MKRHSGFSRDLGEAADGQDAAPCLTINIATCCWQHPHAAGMLGLDLFSRETPTFLFREEKYLQPSLQFQLVVPTKPWQLHPHPEQGGDHRRMQRKGRCWHKDTNEARDCLGLIPNQ